MSRRAVRDTDDGAIAVLVALVLGLGLLLGTGSLVVDAGRLYHEQEQLMSGADAAAWRVAEACITIAPTTCTSAAQTGLAQTFAGANATDGNAAVQLCINTVCPVRGNRTDCLALPAGPGSYAEVRTTTRNTDGTTLLPREFAGAASGAGTKVGACSRVSWGPPRSLPVFGLAVSTCEVAASAGFFGVPGISSSTAVNTGARPMRLGNPATGVDRVVVANVGGLPVCTLGGPPKGYVWLAGPDASCKVTVSLAAPATVGTAAMTAGCRAALIGARDRHEPIIVPVYDTYPGPATYRVVGFAAFVVTGYQGLGGTLDLTGQPSWLRTSQGTSGALCIATQTCIYGYFTKMIRPVARPSFGTGTGYGVDLIGRTG